MKPRGVTVAGNWKMNHTRAEAAAFCKSLSSKLTPNSNGPIFLATAQGKLRSILFPSFLSLEALRDGLQGLPLSVGAQNAAGEKSGAFTGEVSGPMLVEAGVHQVLIGHSERRQFYGETNEGVCRRAEGLLKQGFQVMICIGETLAERERGETEQVLTAQLTALESLKFEFEKGKTTLAYEPVWAIGTGVTATPEQAEAAHQVIRSFLWKNMGMEVAAKTPILYGGSVTPENFGTLLRCPNIDGGLIGGASLSAEKLYSLLSTAAGLAIE